MGNAAQASKLNALQVFGGLKLRAGDRILTSVSEYGSNFLAYLQVHTYMFTPTVKSLLTPKLKQYLVVTIRFGMSYSSSVVVRKQYWRILLTHFQLAAESIVSIAAFSKHVYPFVQRLILETTCSLHVEPVVRLRGLHCILVIHAAEYRGLCMAYCVSQHMCDDSLVTVPVSQACIHGCWMQQCRQ